MWRSKPCSRIRPTGYDKIYQEESYSQTHFEFGIVLSLSRTHTMNDCNEDLNQTDDDGLLRDDVSDEAVEVASVGRTSNSFVWHLLLRLSFSTDEPQPNCSRLQKSKTLFMASAEPAAYMTAAIGARFAVTTKMKFRKLNSFYGNLD
jgi:hypothetical protein